MTEGGDPEVVFEFAVSGTFSVSFQRYVCPASAVVSELPRSWGALPIAETGPREILVPVPEGEALWVGLLSPPGSPAWSVGVVAHLEPEGRTDAVTGLPLEAPGDAPAAVLVPPRRQLEGIARRGGGWWALTRVAPGPHAPSCSALGITAAPAGSRPETPLAVHLLEPAAFSGRTGAAVPPLRTDAPYGGWRLP